MAPHDHGHDHDEDHQHHAPATCASGPFDPDRPVFDEPWQAQALGMAELMKAAGHFTAADWADALGAERARQAAAGEPDTNAAYFQAVLVTLERLTAPAIPPETRARRRAAWEAAYARTPHGQPVLLAPGD